MARRTYYLPTIVAEDGREYTNVSYTDSYKALDALVEFVEIFEDYHDTPIVYTFVQVYEA